MEVRFHRKNRTEIVFHAHLTTCPFIHEKGVNKIMSQINYLLTMTINWLSEVFNFLIICQNSVPGVPCVQISITLHFINKSASFFGILT